MSLLEVLCRLREELPLNRRQAPKRVLLEHYLFQEHDLLQRSSATQTASGTAPGHGRLSQTEGPDGRCSPQQLSSVVEEMFRKARVKRCFQHILRQRQSDDEDRKEVSAASPSGLDLQRSGVGDLGARSERRLPVEQAESPPQVEELHPRRAEDVAESRSPQHSVRAIEPPPPREGNEEETERERRRILLRRFFHAARRRDVVGPNDRLDLGQGGTPAAAGGAPCFTVGGSDTSSVASADHGGQHGPEDVDAGVLVDDNGGARLRRANLLRRILHALRESARERVMEAAPSATPLPPPPPAPQEHVPRLPSLPTPESLRVQDEPQPRPVGPLLHSATYPQGRLPAGTAAAGGDLPVHPRQATRTGQAYQAVFKALAMLLPSCPVGEVSNGGGCGAGAWSGVGRMHAAALRCGVQCQGYIRALQQGIEVIRSGAAGESTRSKLILQAASADGAGVALALHDIDASAEAAAAPAGVRGDAVPSTPASLLLPLARVTRVRCLEGTSTGDVESLGFVVLAVPGAALGEARGRGSSEARSKAPRAQPLITDEEVEPFGVLRAASGEDFDALVLGVASVKSALDSPFRTRKAPNPGTPRTQPTTDPPSGSSLSGPPAATASSSPAAAAAIASATAAACLPWQGARVCIVELAPSLTFLGAVRAVEAEARRVGRDNGLTLRDQNLLICAHLQ